MSKTLRRRARDAANARAAEANTPEALAAEAVREAERARRVKIAMWEGDLDTLYEIAGCHCCCYEHTYGSGCPAYTWGGCRGQGSDEDRKQIEGYAAYYMRTRNMDLDTFYNTRSLS